MNSRQPTENQITEELAVEKRERTRALISMIRVLTTNEAMLSRVPFYLESGADINVDEFVAACEVLRDTWSNTFSLPQPGHIRIEAQKYHQKTGAELRYEQDRQRENHYRLNRMTPEKVRAELANHQHVDPNPVVEKKRIASLERILAGMTGGEVPEPKMRKRGEGGLQPLGEFTDVTEGVL